MRITDGEVQGWLDEIENIERQEKAARKIGKEVYEIYEAKNQKAFNILYSNTETLLPATYSATPRPVVKRRFVEKGGADPVVRAVEMASIRMLEYLMDTDDEEYESFDDSMTDAVRDAALPGRGHTVIKYDADIIGEDESEEVKWATVCTESHRWNRVFIARAEKWSKVPFIAFEFHLDEDESREKFGDEIASKIQYSQTRDDDKNEAEGDVAQFYQIWDKRKRKVVWVSPQLDAVAKREEDPYGLRNFYPMPKPLQFNRKSNSMDVMCLYKQYENQARELNRIQLRLNSVIEAIKVRGAYDGALGGDMERILSEEDNALIPAESSAMLGEADFKKRIWFLPISELMAVAQQLYQARESAKQVIYEISGISDIMRGSSKASETLGAQQIKSSWGTMRLKNYQKEVQRYAKDTMAIMLEMAAKVMPQSVWQSITGLDIPTEEERQMAIAEVSASKVTEDQPDMKTVAVSESPTWEEVMDILGDDILRSYRVDIETNSTLEVEATEDKQLIAEFMNAMAQFLNGVAPMIQEGIMPFGAAKSMLLSISQRFRFGREVEEEIKAMQAPKTDPRVAKAQQELSEAKKTFDSERERVGNELDSRVVKLHEDQRKLDDEKKRFDLEKRYEEKLRNEKSKAMEAEFESAMTGMVDDNQRQIQSMIDKMVARIEKRA